MSVRSYLNDPVRTTTLSSEQIKDYMVCELYYKYKYTDEFTKYKLDDINQQKFDDSIKKTVSFFFYKMQGDGTPSFNALMKKWQRLWFPDTVDSYDIIHERHSILEKNLVTYSNVASKNLLSFYKHFTKVEKGIPTVINEPFVAPIDGGIRISGTIDLVLQKLDGSIKLIKWDTSPTKLKKDDLRLDFAAQYIGYNNAYGVKPKGKMSYHTFSLGSLKDFGSHEVQLKSTDIDTLKYFANKIHKAEKFVPRRKFTTYCSSCPWDVECSEFADWTVLK